MSVVKFFSFPVNTTIKEDCLLILFSSSFLMNLTLFVFMFSRQKLNFRILRQKLFKLSLWFKKIVEKRMIFLFSATLYHLVGPTADELLSKVTPDFTVLC